MTDGINQYCVPYKYIRHSNPGQYKIHRRQNSSQIPISLTSHTIKPAFHQSHAPNTVKKGCNNKRETTGTLVQEAEQEQKQ